MPAIWLQAESGSILSGISVFLKFIPDPRSQIP